MTELLGYSVTKNQDDTGETGQAAYWLEGPRGARYVLVRAMRNPELMYPWNDRRFGLVSVKGYSWFTDRSGQLEPVNG